MTIVLTDSLLAWLPELVLGLGSLITLVLGAWFKRQQPATAAAWVTLSIAAAALTQVPVPPQTATFFGLVLCDAFSYAFRWIALGVAALVLLMVHDARDVRADVKAEFSGLVLLIAIGLMAMAQANHLLMAYLAIEMVSLTSYLLVGFAEDRRAPEAALKYLLYGSLASGLMLFGMSWLFGLTGKLSFPNLSEALAVPQLANSGVLLVAVLLVLVGLAFKISVVPFHMWTPDVYEGAPVAVTALLSVGPKAAGLALLIRMTLAVAPVWPAVEPLMYGLTVLTMTFGNFVALTQTNIKRLLAYSTIGQVGYLLIGYLIQARTGVHSILIYLAAYLFMNLGAFACVSAVVNATGSESLDAFRGLSRRAPSLALLCAVFLLSLAGIPPLFGFFGKFLLFGSALHGGRVALAVVAILNSAVALYYYVNVIRLMYLAEPTQSAPVVPAPSLRIAIWVCGVATIVLGLAPGLSMLLLEAASAVALL